MRDVTTPRTGPVVLDIRLSGRLAPFVTAVTLVGMLPFLGGTDPRPPARESVVLAAGSPAVVDAAGVVRTASSELTQAHTQTFGATGDGLIAAGGGILMFPAISMAPLGAAAATMPTIGTQGFIRPVPGAEASGFGPRIHPVLGVPMFHTGIDLMAVCGTPIRAAASGTVVYAEVSSSWGLRTIIEHTPTLRTAYGHQSRFLVSEGDHVEQGQVIGYVGTTGWSTGCHLHFDVILDDRYVDPAPYLGLPASDAVSIPFHLTSGSHWTPGSPSSSTPAVTPVQDGDVPIPAPAGTTAAPTTTHTTPSTTTGTPTGTTTSTGSPTTSTGTPTAPTTSTPTGTTPAPTTTTPAPTGTATDPTTTTGPTSTTEPTSGTSAPASEPTPTATATAMTSTATAVATTATSVARQTSSSASSGTGTTTSSASGGTSAPAPAGSTSSSASSTPAEPATGTSTSSSTSSSTSTSTTSAAAAG